MRVQKMPGTLVNQCYRFDLRPEEQLLPALAGRCQNRRDKSGRHSSIALLLAPFEGWKTGLLNADLSLNGASCALSYFPQKNRQDGEVLRAVTLDIAAAWHGFMIEFDARLHTTATGAETT